MLKRSFKILKVTFIIISIVYLGSAAFIVKNGLKKQTDKCDVAVVLGTAVTDQGTPSLRLQARLNEAVKLYQQGLFTQIIVTGGTGENGFNEAKTMQQYLMQQGIPKNNILLEPKALNTFQSAKFVSKIIKEHGFEKVMVVSQYFHISRIQLAFEGFGIPFVYRSHPDFFEWRDIYSILREVPAYTYYWLQFSGLSML